jgi:hypothetical protein
MKKNNYFIIRAFSFAFVLLLTCMFFCSVSANAQRGDAQVRITISDMDIRLKRSPDFTDDSYAKAKDGDLEWLQFVIEYATKTPPSEGWLDSLTLRWHVLLLGGKDDKRLYMTETVEYIDIQDDDDHHAIAFMRPRAILRHFDDRGKVRPNNVAVYVEALVNNVRVGDYTYNKTKETLPDAWWRHPSLTKIENALLSRDKTPFADLNYDYYETIKPRER